MCHWLTKQKAAVVAAFLLSSCVIVNDNDKITINVNDSIKAEKETN